MQYRSDTAHSPDPFADPRSQTNNRVVSEASPALHRIATIAARSMRFFTVGLAALWFAPGRAGAQDDLAKKLEDLSAAIAREPANGALYFTRADLHRRANDVDAALADLEYGARLPGGELRGNLLAAE